MTSHFEKGVSDKTESKHKINMWNGDRFKPMKYYADATFYPHGCFDFCYCGHIYDSLGKMIGDYAASDSCWIEQNFNIEWR